MYREAKLLYFALSSRQKGNRVLNNFQKFSQIAFKNRVLERTGSD